MMRSCKHDGFHRSELNKCRLFTKALLRGAATNQSGPRSPMSRLRLRLTDVTSISPSLEKEKLVISSSVLAAAHLVRRRLISAETWVHAQGCPWDLCGEHGTGRWDRFLS